MNKSKGYGKGGSRKADVFAGKGSIAGKLKDRRKKMESGDYGTGNYRVDKRK